MNLHCVANTVDNAAFARDLLLEYPDITGFRIDWPEYPCYTWGELFADFSPHVAGFAAAHGFDFERIRTDVSNFKLYCEQQLTNEQLAQVASQHRVDKEIPPALGEDWSRKGPYNKDLEEFSTKQLGKLRQDTHLTPI